jgi:hypothetical protein
MVQLSYNLLEFIVRGGPLEGFPHVLDFGLEPDLQIAEVLRDATCALFGDNLLFILEKLDRLLFDAIRPDQ